MNPDFRQRVFLPIVMPVGVAAGFVGFAWALSRVLLAVPESAATAIALGVAAYVLLVASLVSAKERITSRALAVGVALGVVAIFASGAIAWLAGPREFHEEEALAAEATEAEAVPPDTFVAVDIAFSAAPETLPAGSTEITLINEGATLHNVAFEEVNNEEPVVQAPPGETEAGIVSLEPGAYVYFCDVPGHREAGMEGELTVEG